MLFFTYCLHARYGSAYRLLADVGTERAIIKLEKKLEKWSKMRKNNAQLND